MSAFLHTTHGAKCFMGVAHFTLKPPPGATSHDHLMDKKRKAQRGKVTSNI